MEHGEIKEAGGGGMTTSSSSAAARKGSSGSHEVLKCPRCDSLNTKFCYYNNYNLSQPRHFCKNCRRYWTKGGSLRSVPVGGGCRKNKRSRHGSNGPNASGAIRSNLTSSVSLLDVGHLSGSGGPSTSAFLHSVPPHLLQLHDYASASSAAANHNNFGLTFSRLQESMRSSPSASLMMPAHSYEPLNLNPHLNLDQTSLVNHLGIYNNNNSNTLNTTSCTNTTNTNTNHNNHNPPPATDLSLLIDDHHRPFTANTTSTAPAVAHAEWSKLHAEHHPHKLGLTSNCMQLMQMNDHDHENDHDHGHGHGHGHHGFGHIIPPPGFPEEEKPLTGQSNTIDHQQHQWFQGGVQQMESGILQEGWAWPDFFSLAGSAAGTIP